MTNAMVRVFAPGSIGNLGPGLDVLGLALDGPGDEVTLRWKNERGIEIIDPGHPQLPRDPAKHTAAIAVSAVFDRVGVTHGATIEVRKGLPLSGGQGGSAASAVAGAVAANHLLNAGFDTAMLLECALAAEKTMSGYHADNVAPALVGGFVLIRSLLPIDIIQVPVPDIVRVVLVRPEQELLTRDAREVLPDQVSLATALHQAAQIAAMVAGGCLNDIGLFGRAIDDRIAEPAREPLLPGFASAKRHALAAGALGCSISGSGPTAFAIVDSEVTGEKVLAEMIAAYREAGLNAHGRVAGVDHQGARIIA